MTEPHQPSSTIPVPPIGFVYFGASLPACTRYAHMCKGGL